MTDEEFQAQLDDILADIEAAGVDRETILQELRKMRVRAEQGDDIIT